MLSIYIPETEFAEGGTFENISPPKVQIIIPLSHIGNKVIKATSNPQSLEDWEFQPKSNHDYHDILEIVRSGKVVIERDGVIQTPENLITLFKENYQEL